MLKLHSRCNLACRYCYVYRNVDQSWREQPVTMSREVVDLAAKRIAEHAQRHRPPYVTIIFHGGEPLLAGADFIAATATAIRVAAEPFTRVDLRIQTNGVLLDEALLAVLAEHRIRVGVSLDGGLAANDQHRVFANGHGSFQAVARALRLLNEERHRPSYGGILCTINVANDPLGVYRDLIAFQPPRMNFLLPHGNWSAPPPGRSTMGTGTPYADWLIPIFDEWYRTYPQQTTVRLFESIIDMVLGGATSSEAVGFGPDGLIVIECDGSIEQNDSLKTTVDGGAATGMHLRDSTFDEVNELPIFRAQQAGPAALSTTCQACPLVELCGVGLYAHRYRADNGFDNPSVYCPDLMALISHIRGRVLFDLTRSGQPVSSGA